MAEAISTFGLLLPARIRKASEISLELLPVRSRSHTRDRSFGDGRVALHHHRLFVVVASGHGEGHNGHAGNCELFHIGNPQEFNRNADEPTDGNEATQSTFTVSPPNGGVRLSFWWPAMQTCNSD
jgi:hypothetical protein